MIKNGDRIDTKLLVNLKRVNLGGTGEMYEMTNGNGGYYLFKPSFSKYNEQFEPFRAKIQEAAYRVQKIVNPEGAIKCQTAEINGMYGAIQEKVATSSDFDLFKWQIEGGYIPKTLLDGIMKEYITDYLLCNYDAHSRNFIIGQDGIVRGVDKEQSFRYINDKLSQRPSKDYHPNQRYNELEPIYNTIFKRFIEGKLDIDFSIIYSSMDRVKRINSGDYREIFREYAKDLRGEDESENLLDLIVMRKDNMVDLVNQFIAQIKAKRNVFMNTQKDVLKSKPSCGNTTQNELLGYNER